MKVRHIALIPAAGTGSRMGGNLPKQYQLLAGQPVLWHTLSVLAAEPRLDVLAVVLHPGDVWFDQFAWPGGDRLLVLRSGGASRAESVRNGLFALAAEDRDWILVHDAARCCLPRAALARLLDTLAGDPIGGLLALPVADTVKKEGEGGRIASTVPRDGLWLAQTPQMFRAALLTEALSDACDVSITDEASAIEQLGLAPRLVQGDAFNFKVTWPHDLALAERVLLCHPQGETV